MQSMHRVARSGPRKDPARWTEAAFLRHMVHVQGLRRRSKAGAESTALHRARYVRQLVRGGVVLAPVPDEETWLDWLDMRLDEGAQLGQFNLQRLALRSWFAYVGLDPWPSLMRSFPKTYREWDLIADDAVTELRRRRDLHPNAHLAELARAALSWTFGTGLRPPSELVTLELGDIDWQTGRVVVWESKKDAPRTIGPIHADVLADLRGYVDGPRAEVARHGERAVFVGEKGHRLATRYLARIMRDAGRQAWDGFHPYQCRYWYATKRLIQTGFNTYVVAHELGDTEAVVARHYVHKATVAMHLPTHGIAAETATA